MYSYEDRIRAVKIYIKLSKSTYLTILQFGYPTKNSLKGWYREYERNRDLQVRYARSKEKYTAEQMQIAVQHYPDVLPWKAVELIAVRNSQVMATDLNQQIMRAITTQPCKYQSASGFVIPSICAITSGDSRAITSRASRLSFSCLSFDAPVMTVLT